MMKYAIPVLLAHLVGCAGTPSSDPCPIAQDPVCLYFRDLGCVSVRVDEDTPRTEYGGETYYFCNASCRDRFDEEPKKYLAGTH
jgi:Cu+-exporting ATPase